MLIFSLPDESTSNLLKILASAFSAIFYLALLYNAAWDTGAKDRLRVDGGKMQPQPFKGALTALCANSINLVLALGGLIFGIIYLSSGNEVANTVFTVLTFLATVVEMMFFGFISEICSALSSHEIVPFVLQDVGYIIGPLLAIAVTQVGYMLGMREWRIQDMFSSKKG